MALPSSGAISLSQVNVELGVSATATRSLNDSTTRTLFGVPSGAISMSNGYGKANQFSFTISANQTNADLRTLAVNAGWNQSSTLVVTVNSGVYISSNSTSTPALTIAGSFPGGVHLVNNGTIVGMGGAGGNGSFFTPFTPISTAGAAGGLALSVSTGVTITNYGTIAGGGGGGGGGNGARTGISGSYAYYGGGGGGGGRSSAAANSAGGTGATGDPGGAGSPGQNGGIGTVSSNGAGGASGGSIAAAGGSGGAWGAAGGNSSKTGGAGGAAVTGNGWISWAATGTRYGAIG